MKTFCLKIIIGWLVWMFFPLWLGAQPRQMLSLQLRNALEELEPHTQVDLYLRGDIVALQDFVKTNNGVVKGSIKNIVSCRLPASKIKELNHLAELDFVEFSNSNPQILNDVMVFNNNIHPIHMGVSPLQQAYFGEEVIIGVIDTGIELAHPDFQNPDGSTRVMALWDQTQTEEVPYRVPEPYGYGQEWNAEDIDAGITEHQDQPMQYGHGSNVAGVAASNGLATGNYSGVAPHADLIVVSSKLNAPNWPATVADAVDFIFKKAEGFGKPVVINLSLGDYFGSHDALDAPTLFVEELLEQAPGRVMVAACGNSGDLGNYHLSYDIPQADTAFTWFKYNNSVQAVLFELWADTSDFSQTKFSLGADVVAPDYEFRGYVNWRSAQENLNTILVDTLFYNGQSMGIVETWVGLRGEQYLIQVQVTQPFSNQYAWRFATTGGGKFDCWSYAPFGSSQILEENLPSSAFYPAMEQYRYPDKHKTIVDGWVCSEKVIAVGNYINRNSFENYLDETTIFDDTPGEISKNSSRGPTRDLRQKPDIAASGDHTVTTGKISILNSWKNIEPQKVALDGMHYVNGGTSMASPVVAGAVALFFSHADTLNYQEIKNAIIQTALADIHTGVLPGNQFGYGKLNAFGAFTELFGDVVNVRENNRQHVKMFPNPTRGQLKFEFNNSLSANVISIYDLSGRRIIQEKITMGNGDFFEMDVSFLQSGMYLVKIKCTDGNILETKLIFEK